MVVLIVLSGLLLGVKWVWFGDAVPDTVWPRHMLGQLQLAAALGLFALLSPGRWQRWAFPALWTLVGIVGWPR